jgi:PAS domain S-box-containing protein
MAVAIAPPTKPLGDASPILGRRIDLGFHSARALSASVAVLSYGFLALSWGWQAAWIVVVMSTVIATHAVVRRSEGSLTRGTEGVMLALGIDILWVAVIYVVTRPPALAVVPGLTYLVVAPVLVLDGWKAAGMLIGAKVGVVTALVITLAAPDQSLAVGRVLMMTGLGAAIHLPTMVWLIVTATKNLRSRSEIAVELAAKEAQLRMITDSATDGIVALDGSGRIRLANRGVESLFGWTAKEMVGRSVTDFIPSFGQNRAPKLTHRSDFLRLALPGVRRDGGAVPLELTLGRTDEGGDPVYVCVLRDVSEREEAAQRIEFQASLLDQVRLAVVAARPDGRLAYGNATAVAMFGLRPEIMPTIGMWDLLTDPEQGHGARRSLQHDATMSAEMQLKAYDGTSFPALVTVTRVHGRNGDPIGFAGIAIDITERKRTEEKLAALVASKDEFVTSVSHELRTPLTVILGMAEELRRDFKQFGSDDVHQMIELIADQSRDLANIVQDLLVIGRADAGGSLVINPSAVDLKTEMVHALEVYVPFDRTPTLEVEIASPVWADPGRLRQIVRNLVTNAVRYGGPHLKVRVSQDPEVTTVSLADDGKGVAPEDVDQIFLPYVRSKAGPALPGSMGLGLAVARKLCKLMGGDLTYRRDDGWSVFEVTLPTAQEGAAALNSQIRSGQDFGQDSIR